MTLKEFKARFVVGKTFECVENTKRPEINGDIRTIKKVQGNAVRYTSQKMSGPPGASCYTAFPKARDIISAEGDLVKFRMEGTEYTLTWRISA